MDSGLQTLRPSLRRTERRLGLIESAHPRAHDAASGHKIENAGLIGARLYRWRRGGCRKLMRRHLSPAIAAATEHLDRFVAQTF
jgi:hypothetical protein